MTRSIGSYPRSCTCYCLFTIKYLQNGPHLAQPAYGLKQWSVIRQEWKHVHPSPSGGMFLWVILQECTNCVHSNMTISNLNLKPSCWLQLTTKFPQYYLRITDHSPVLTAHRRLLHYSLELLTGSNAPHRKWSGQMCPFWWVMFGLVHFYQL